MQLQGKLPRLFLYVSLGTKNLFFSRRVEIGGRYEQWSREEENFSRDTGIGDRARKSSRTQGTSMPFHSQFLLMKGKARNVWILFLNVRTILYIYIFYCHVSLCRSARESKIRTCIAVYVLILFQIWRKHKNSKKTAVLCRMLVPVSVGATSKRARRAFEGLD